MLKHDEDASELSAIMRCCYPPKAEKIWLDLASPPICMHFSQVTPTVFACQGQRSACYLWLYAYSFQVLEAKKGEED